MSLNHRPPSLETRPLLNQPPSYRSIDDVSSRTRVPTDTTESPPQPVRGTELAWILAGLWSGLLLGAFDGTVVATLLTPIGSEFNASHKASYIGSSYLLSVCCFTPLYGRLADILGRRGAMLLALTLFGSGTMFCGMAPSIDLFIAGRIVAGMGGGGIMTVASIAVTDLIPLKQRGLYQGVANVIYGMGAALGGPFGGWAHDTFGWRYAFYMQGPIVLLSGCLVAWKVDIKLSDEIQHQKISDKLRRIDFLGSFTMAGAVACLLLGIDLKTTDMLEWTHPVILLLLSSSASFAFAFLMVEEYWAPFPVIPLRLLTQRHPLCIALSNLFLSMGVFSMLFSAPIFFTTVRSTGSTLAGFYLLPHSLFIPVGSVFAGWFMRKTGRFHRLTLVSAVMTFLASVLASCWSGNTPSFHLWLDLLPQSFGFASFITTTLIAMIAGIRKEDMPVGIGITYVFRTTGQVLGVSLSGAVLQAVLLQKLRARIRGPGAEKTIHSIRHSAEVIPTLEPHLRKVAIKSYADALRVVFICQAAICLLGFLASLPIQESGLGPTQAGQEQPACHDHHETNDL